MANYTLTYADNVGGWVSFYSFYPDWIIGMNQHLYTFKNGNLYKHNENALYNNFYGEQFSSRVTSVFNDTPLQNSIYKTMNLESDNPWDATLETDIQTTGFIDADWFEKKENSWYAFVRNSGTTPADPEQNYPLRSLNGVGRSQSVDTTDPAAVIINFSTSPIVSIGDIISIGDNLYLSLPPLYDTPVFVGEVTDIIVDYTVGDNYMVVDTTVPSGSLPSIQDAYYLYIKNSIAESHGVLGHYCIFTLENDNAEFNELFSVESQVMKSFP